ncbi:MAG: hypothetical protein J6S45_05520, partial [Firmicutes bacterium]|nr:hypothetical protein [Bacillota bacterium]
MSEMNLPQIHALPKHVSDKIAAGEVVDRPLSIVKELMENREREKTLSDLYAYARERLSAFQQNIPEKACPSILNISLVGFRSEIILHALSRDSIFVSSGSACSSHSGKSGVLQAFGLD